MELALFYLSVGIKLVSVDEKIKTLFAGRR
jgi:hypothetical protein